MKRRIKGIILAAPVLTVLFLLTSVLVASPAYATDPPDSTPTATFYVYRNLLETGDRLMLIYQNIPYGTIPDEPVWQTFMWRVIDTDNTTELGAALSYSFNDKGYGYNLTSMYWNAANVTASGMTWGTAYNVRLSENPIWFTSPTEYNFTLSASDYSALADAAGVQSELAARILVIAADLDIKWALGTTYSLIQETETGTVLSIYGEAFFRGAIYGLQGLCPQIFAYVVSDMDLTPRSWTTTYVTTLQNQWNGTWVDTAKTALDSLFGTSYSLSWLLVSLAAALVVLVLGFVVSSDAWVGIMLAFVVVILAARLGFVDLGYVGLAAGVAVMYVSARIWGVFSR